jgi:hypothetical protein
MRAFIGASEVTSRCQHMQYTPDLNALWSADIRLASTYATGVTEGGTELIITANNGTTVLFAGPCWYGEDDGDANDQMTTLTGFDHRCKWPFRQVQDDDGDYSDPSIFQDFENAVDIMEAAIDNDIANDGSYGISNGSTSASSFPLIGFKPTDWPWSLQHLWDFLVNTGTLDVMLSPAIGGSTVDLFPGDAGTDLSGSVVFDYNTGSFNCIGAKYTFDMKNTISRIRYFLGPKRPFYRGDIQHYSGDVQIDDPALDIYDPVKQAQIDTQSAAIEGVTGLMREIQIYDANPPLPIGANPPEQTGENALRDLYYALWQSEMLVRTVPRRLLSITPEPGISPTFGVGDLITANAVLRGTVGGVQRVYRFTVEQDPEGNEMLTNLVTSADGEF